VVEMHEKQVKNLQAFKTAAAYGGGFGVIFLLFGIFASDYILMLGLGIGITAASIVLFLFGTFLSLMEEYAYTNKGKTSMARSSGQFYYEYTKKSESALKNGFELRASRRWS
jgi:ABC-type multidrug transport system permease subunit